MYSDEEITQIVVDEVTAMIELLGFGGEMSAELSLGENERKYINVELNGDDLGLLIGFQGNSLRSFEHVVSLIVNRKLKKKDEQTGIVRVRMDVNSYRAKREDAIRNLAIKAIDQVKESGQDLELSPMNPAERRIVHLVVKEEGGVSSDSVGEEGERRIIIKPE